MTLVESVRSYVERKRATGLAYIKSAPILSAFRTQVGDVPLDHITAREVAKFFWNYYHKKV